MNQKQICCINCYPREHANEVGCQRVDCQCHQKQSWEEEFENMPLEYFADSVFSTSGNPSELEFINWQRETTRRAIQKKEFFKKIICRAIQTREREISEEVEKEKIICEHCKKPFDETARTYDGVANCQCKDGKYAYKNSWEDIGFNEACDKVLSIINNK